MGELGLRRRLWKLLGGAVDDEGQPMLDPDTPVDVFVGYERDARDAVAVLVRAGLEGSCQVMPTYPQPESLVAVRVPSEQEERAIHILRNDDRWGRFYRTEPDTVVDRPDGYWGVGEYRDPGEVDRAKRALYDAGIPHFVNDPDTGPLRLGYMISVPNKHIQAAADCLRAAGLQATGWD